VGTAPSFVQVVDINSGISDFELAQAQGDIIICCIFVTGDTGATPTPGDTSGNNYVYVTDVTATSDLHIWLYIASNIKAAAAGANTPSVSWSAPQSNNVGVAWLEYSGPGPRDALASSTGNGVITLTTTETTTHPVDIVFFFAARQDFGPMVVSGGAYTFRDPNPEAPGLGYNLQVWETPTCPPILTGIAYFVGDVFTSVAGSQTATAANGNGVTANSAQILVSLSCLNPYDVNVWAEA
jgi:hypothetical protein